MRSGAGLIAASLESDVAARILKLTAAGELALHDARLRPIPRPELEPIARALPFDAIRQICLLAERLGFGYSDVTAEVANAVARRWKPT